MRLLISNQHGAWVMALMPFLYAQISSPWVWQSIFLLFGFVAVQFFSYPFLNLFKPNLNHPKLKFYAQWALIYGTMAIVLITPAIYFNWQIILFLPAIFPLIAINIFYVRKRNERSLINDLAGVGIFGVFAMGAYYFTTWQINYNVATWPCLFEVGAILYVKSMLRERKNPKYYWASLVIHWGLLIFFFTQAIALGLSFFPACLRACILPFYKLSTKQVGIGEFIFSSIFFMGLILT